MKSRSELRDIIVKVLYQTYIYETTNTEVKTKDIIKEFINYDEEYISSAIDYITKNQKSINEIANKYLDNWTIDRLSKVDKAILSLAIYEMTNTDTPKIVCINEAIELSKKYSDENVTKMINACLDKYYHDIEE